MEVTLVRSVGPYAYEESYTIYEGEGTTGAIVVPRTYELKWRIHMEMVGRRHPR